MNIKEILKNYYNSKVKDSPTVSKYTDFLSFDYGDVIPQELQFEKCSSNFSPLNEMDYLNYNYKTGSYLVSQDKISLKGNYIAELVFNKKNSNLNVDIDSEFSSLVFTGSIESSSLTINLKGKFNYLCIDTQFLGEVKVRINSFFSDKSVVYIRGIANNSNLNISSRTLAKEHADFNVETKHINSNSSIEMKGVNLGGKLILRGNPILLDNSYSNLIIQIITVKGQSYGIPELTINSNSSSGNHSLSIRKISENWINYLLARGLSKESAEKIILDSFLFDIIYK
ncbi:MAG: SufD family Fe-S cluster assembly protein [Candidatus Rehaiarchaeum fermentans]|nr:SufD family Fe-S cluster assembly protein [Candidatus Rehaiarchaeum fermentans]